MFEIEDINEAPNIDGMVDNSVFEPKEVIEDEDDNNFTPLIRLRDDVKQIVPEEQDDVIEHDIFHPIEPIQTKEKPRTVDFLTHIVEEFLDMVGELLIGPQETHETFYTYIKETFTKNDRIIIISIIVILISLIIMVFKNI
jgi:hypothetical protein